eukprot:4730689-Prymnesium_polylepis.1
MTCTPPYDTRTAIRTVEYGVVDHSQIHVIAQVRHPPVQPLGGFATSACAERGTRRRARALVVTGAHEAPDH